MLCYLEHKITKENFNGLFQMMSSDTFYDAAQTHDLVVKYPKNFDRIDWSIEPIESFTILRSQRAQQLRESSSYIALYFSGGSDSTAVLNTFVLNNIPIDEVIINRFSDVPDIRHNGQVAIDYLKSIDYKGKVNIVDIDYKIINSLLVKQIWTKSNNFTGLLHSILRMRIDFFEQNNLIPIKNIRPINTTHLYCETTPIISVINKKYYAQFPVRAIGISTYQKGNIQFFTSEDFPQLHIKQCHILVNYFKEHYPEETSILESSKKYHKIIKNLIRDPWDTRADFTLKTGSEGIRSIVNPNSEAFSVYNFYRINDANFTNNYYDSTVKEFLKTKLYKKYTRIAPPLSSSITPPNFYIAEAKI
jgi:hypothetical protein